MRLTTVTRMRLPAGRLYSYAVSSPGPVGRRVPLSFDQRRHVGEGPRAASWMAVSFRLPHPVDRERVSGAWLSVLRRHGTFRTAFVEQDAEGPALHEIEIDAGAWTECAIPRGRLPRDVVRELFDAACSPYERPSYRLCLLEPDDDPDGGDASAPTVVIGADHAHVDMWSWHVVARDLLTALDADHAQPAGQGADPGPWAPAASFAEHTQLLERMPPAPAEMRARWRALLAAESGAMPRFPLPLGDVSRPRAAVVEVHDVLDAEALARFEQAAAARGVRGTALAVSVLTRVTARLTDGAPLRAVFPVHSRYEPRWHDAVGWFITNAVLESRDPDPAACAAAVKEAIALGSYPLAPIFAPLGGMPIRPGMFALSWLDARRLPVPSGPELELQHVSAAVEVDGVMAWLICTWTGLQVRCRYPDTPEAKHSVGAWLDGVIDGLRAAAR